MRYYEFQKRTNESICLADIEQKYGAIEKDSCISSHNKLFRECVGVITNNKNPMLLSEGDLKSGAKLFSEIYNKKFGYVLTESIRDRQYVDYHFDKFNDSLKTIPQTYKEGDNVYIAELQVAYSTKRITLRYLDNPKIISQINNDVVVFDDGDFYPRKTQKLADIERTIAISKNKSDIDKIVSNFIIMGDAENYDFSEWRVIVSPIE